MAPVRQVAIRPALVRRGDSDAYFPGTKAQSKSPSPESPELSALADDLRLHLSLSNKGLPTREQYEKVVDNYYENLTPRKREKALLDAEQWNDVVAVLEDPAGKKVRTPQFRFWVRKMFKMGHSADGSAHPIHEDRVVAQKHNIYDIICAAHNSTTHAGRDRTNARIREHYSWIPKDIVAGFVKACPTCEIKRSGDQELRDMVLEELATQRASPTPRQDAPPKFAMRAPFESNPFAFTADGAPMQLDDLPEPLLLPTSPQPEREDVKGDMPPWMLSLPAFARPTTASSIGSSSASSSRSASSSYSMPSPSELSRPLPMTRALSAPIPVALPMAVPASMPLSASAVESDANCYEAFWNQPFFTAPLPEPPFAGLGLFGPMSGLPDLSLDASPFSPSNNALGLYHVSTPPPFDCVDPAEICGPSRSSRSVSPPPCETVEESLFTPTVPAEPFHSMKTRSKLEMPPLSPE